MKQPNILMIFSDQHRFDCLGVNGHPMVRTPNLDRLAATGTNFTNAFTSSPICVPARNSLMHGNWPCKHQGICNGGTEAPRGPLPTRSFSEVLHDAGYYLALTGKWCDGEVRPPSEYGYDEYTPGSEYRRWREAQGLPPRPGALPFFGKDDAITPEQTHLWWEADQTIEKLRRISRLGQPFCIGWHPSEPHLPNVVPEPYASMYPPSGIAPWPSFGDTFEGKPYIQAQQLRSWKLDGWTWAQWAPLVSLYLGEITLLDRCIGRVLDELDNLALSNDTIVIYTCDHGDTCGGHGMIDKHYIMYEDVVHVPLIIRWPGAAACGKTCDTFVTQTIDIARTLCEWAGADVPGTFQGMTLIPALQCQPFKERTEALSMYFGNQFGLFSQRMVRDKQWKYVWNGTAEDELYNLDNDKGELHNLATSPDCADILARLRLRLWDIMQEVGDPLANFWIKRQLVEGRKI
ncbi:MAG: sulfatase-like hydrolase/transferase [Victivallales bacterium]|nr:sulfatase-like hydrolase/transferase [Victivallales bacterium]